MAFTASQNFSDTGPGTTGDGIGLPNCSRMNATRNRRDGNARAAKNPRPAGLAGDAPHERAL